MGYKFVSLLVTKREAKKWLLTYKWNCSIMRVRGLGPQGGGGRPLGKHSITYQIVVILHLCRKHGYIQASYTPYMEFMRPVFHYLKKKLWVHILPPSIAYTMGLHSKLDLFV